MVDVSELVVRAKPEGLDETTDGLEDMEGSFEETAESVGDSADEMDNFSSKWAGAMNAIVAGLAVASAGLLSQVPVLGEVFGGLVAIIEALAFQMDQVLRPVLTPITNALYDISSAIFELEGPLGDVVGLFTTLATVLVPAVAILSRLGFISFTLSGALSSLVGWITGLVSGTLALPVAIGAIIGLFGVWALEALGVLDAVQNLGRWIGNLLPGIVRDGILTIIGIFAGPLAVIGGFITGFIEGGFEEGIERAQEIIDIFIGAAARLFQPIADVITGIFETLQNIVSQTWDAIVEISMNLLGFDEQTFRAGESQTIGGSIPGSPTITVPGAENTSNTTSRPSINMDGRRLNEDTGRYRSDQTSRRGRFG